jgi:hypothetical protein
MQLMDSTAAPAGMQSWLAPPLHGVVILRLVVEFSGVVHVNVSPVAAKPACRF